MWALAGMALAGTPAYGGAGGIPTRSPDGPTAPPMTRVAPSTEELAAIDASFRKMVAGSDPAAAAILEKYPTISLGVPGGINPPVNQNGNFIIGPVYVRAAEMNVMPGVPQGKVVRFTMKSEDSQIYPGIDYTGTRDVDPDNKYTVKVETHQAPWTRTVLVYVPAGYVPGTPLPLLVGADGPDAGLPTVLDNLIAQKRVPMMGAISIQHGGKDAQGSQRGLEYDTMSGRYAEFVEYEVIPKAEEAAGVKFTKDPEARATMGGSSGGSAALEMAWYHPEWYHRVLTYSGTYVNQQWPFNAETPHGAWGFHETLIPNSERKPLRIWMEVGDRDNYNPNVMRDDMHDWVEANYLMAKVLAAKGYPYQFVFAQNAGHTDGNVRGQTLPDALEWLWQGYKPSGK